MIATTVLLRGGVALLKAFERPLASLRTATDMWAGVTKQETKMLVQLPLVVTKKSFETVTGHPDVRQAYAEALALQSAGVLAPCTACGALHQ